MRYAVRYSRAALTVLKQLRPYDRTAILSSIDRVLTANPTLESRARVKRLRQPAAAQYRLRVGEFRVLYDVVGQTVDIVLILPKAAAGTEQGEA